MNPKQKAIFLLYKIFWKYSFLVTNSDVNTTIATTQNKNVKGPNKW